MKIIKICKDCNKKFMINMDSNQTRCIICWIVYHGLDDREGAEKTLTGIKQCDLF